MLFFLTPNVSMEAVLEVMDGQAQLYTPSARVFIVTVPSRNQSNFNFF